MAPAPAAGVWATTTATVVQVIDGDTVMVKLDGGTGTVRVRYIGIDTPEQYPEQTCGAASATKRNRELVEGKTVTLVPDREGYDRYGRRLAYVFVGTEFVNEVLVTEGQARVLTVPPNTRYADEFERKATSARSKGWGVWQCM